MRKIKYRNDVFYIVLAFICVWWAAFYSNYADTGVLDVRNHTKVANYILSKNPEGENPFPHVATYPLYHITQKVLARGLDIPYEAAAVVVICCSNIAAILLFRMLVLQVLKKKETSAFIDFISIGAVIFMPGRSWLTDYSFYQNHVGANPLHNPTILFVRPFGILCVMAFLKILEGHEGGKIDIRYYCLWAVSALLSVFAKPSFAFTFFPAMGIMCLIKMIEHKDIVLGLKMLAGILPSGAVLLWQLISIMGSSDALETTVVLGGFTTYYTDYSFLDIIRVTVGVIPCAILLISRVRDDSYVLAWIAFVIGWLQMFLLSNGPTGDYSWGYMLAMQFVTIITLALTIGDSESKVGKWRKILGVLIFAYQIFAGIQYYFEIFHQGKIWI